MGCAVFDRSWVGDATGESAAEWRLDPRRLQAGIRHRKKCAALESAAQGHPIEPARSAPIRMQAAALNAAAESAVGIFLKAPLPDRVREGAVNGRVLASNLEIFGRGLAAIGNLFVFHGLSFVERRKTGFLDRRNMNKYVFAATRGLDETKTLGRVEPLHSTFSHHVVSAGSKNNYELPVPAKTVTSGGRTILGKWQA
jgi:hypothetical protein